MGRETSEQLLDTKGVAALLRVHPKHVFRLLKRGLPGHRLGGEWRFEPAAVLQWMRADSGRRSLAPSAVGRAEPPPLVAANGDVCIELLLEALARSSKTPFGLVQADRTSGRAHVESGGVLAAGVHGEDLARATDPLLRVHVTRRSVGLAYPKGKRLRSLGAVAGLRLASRAPTAGVRQHFEAALAAERLDSAELHAKASLCGSHRDVALSVLSGQSDVGILTVAWAERAGLACLPFAEEDYALSLRADALAHEIGRVLLRALQGPALKRSLARVAGYEPRALGNVV